MVRSDVHVPREEPRLVRPRVQLPGRPFGRAFEGRYGGAQLPVLGAHTGEFNANSFGVSLIGNFEKTAPTRQMLERTAR